MSRRNAVSLARHAAADMADTLAQVAVSRAAQHAETRARVTAARDVERAGRRFTAADVTGARYVRDRWGWWPVVRANTHTVTVQDGNDTTLIPLTRVLETRP
jgi:sRNA-binding protein